MGFALRAKRGESSFPSLTSKARRPPSSFGVLAARSPRRFRTHPDGEAASSGYAKSTLIDPSDAIMFTSIVLRQVLVRAARGPMLGGTSGVFNRHEAEAGQPLTAERSPESPVGELSPSARRVATSAEAGQAARRSYRWCRPVRATRSRRCPTRCRTWRVRGIFEHRRKRVEP